MGQPVKLSDELMLDARTTGEVVKRSISGQVEFWARLGKGVEMLLETPQVFALCRQGASRPLSECLNSVDSAEGKHRVADSYVPSPSLTMNRIQTVKACSYGLRRMVGGLSGASCIVSSRPLKQRLERRADNPLA